MRKKLCIFICMSCVLIFISSFIANADTGPKPKLTILVENPPAEEYYLDLLVNFKGDYNNLANTDKKYDEMMLKKLKSLEGEGWYPAFSGGTNAPLWGELTGKATGNKMVHTFGYVGVPDTYRIIIATKSGNVKVSDIRKRFAMQDTVKYDYLTGKITEDPIALSYLNQFIVTCMPTLIIEGIILLLFGFKFAENWKLFLLLNIGTQILLTAVIGTVLIKSGTFSAYLAMIPTEFFILPLEMAVCAGFLRGHSKNRKLVYAACANLASWIFSYIMIDMFIK